MRRTPAGILFDGSSVELSHADAATIPANTGGLLAKGSDAGTARRWKVDATGALSVIPTGVIQVRPAEWPTFTFSSGSIGFISTGLNVDMGHVFVAGGGAYLLRIHHIMLINVNTAAVTGVMANFELQRFTSAGTPSTGLLSASLDSGDTKDSSITSAGGSTLTGATTIGFVRGWSTEEMTNATGSPRTEAPAMQHFPVGYAATYRKQIIVRPGSGLAVVCTTNTTTGRFYVEMLGTQEPL